MAFEDSARTTAASRYRGEGFRPEPVFGEGSTVTTTPTAPDGTGEAPVTPVPARNLDYVFDDPADGEPGRDRLLVHGLWELLLAVAVGALVWLLYRENADALSEAGLRGLALTVAALGALVAASAIALRAAAPNLAVGPVAVAAGLWFGAHSDGALLPSLLLLVGLAAAVGAVQALVTVGLHVPGWASSLGVGLAVVVWSGRQVPTPPTGRYDAAPDAYWWFGGLVALSLLASVVGLVPSVRRLFGRFRPVTDPANRRGVVAAVVTAAAVVVSSVLAAVGGALISSAGSGVVGNSADSVDAFVLTALALGTALLGGTSAYGRRGGIAGTVLATMLVVVAWTYLFEIVERWEPALVAAIVLGLGLVVTRLVERFGRPAPSVITETTEDDWAPRAHSVPARSWQPSTTATTSVGGLWASDEAWGSGER
jgi:hypothetical protein